MTERLIAEHDVLRCDQTPTTTPAQQQAAARTAAAYATDPDELAQLLDMLGLDPQEARP